MNERDIKLRLADKYTAMELVEALDVPVEDIIEEYYHLVPDWMLREIGVG